MRERAHFPSLVAISDARTFCSHIDEKALARNSPPKAR
jgi:hypothetical protein